MSEGQWRGPEKLPDSVPPAPPAPTVGRVVHYVSYGTPNGEYQSQCRAAHVTEVETTNNPSSRVGLAVLNPTGLFFHPLDAGGCAYDGSDHPQGGTWHWPERA